MAPTGGFRQHKAERLAILGFGVSMLLLVVLGVTLYLAGERARISGVLGDRSLQVLGSLANIDAEIARSQSGQRGYALFGEQRFLRQRDEALDAARKEAERLKRLSAGGFVDRTSVERLADLIGQRAQRMRLGMQAWREGAQAGPPGPAPGASATLSTRIYALTAAMRDAQLAALAAQRGEEEAHFRAVYVLLGVAAVLLCAVLLPVYVAFVREARSRERAESRIHELAESLPGAVFQARLWPDGTLRFDFLSSSARDVRGIDPGVTFGHGKGAVDNIHEDDRKTFREALANAARRMQPLHLDYRIHHPEKGVRWIRSVSAPAAQADGCVRWSGHWADITTQKEMEAGLLRAMEEAGAASEAKSRFLATVSHEIRTPMNGILAMLELLSLTRLDEEQAASLAIVRDSGRTLLRIIDDILDFSKIEAGKMDVTPEPSSIERLVERVMNIHSGIASAKGLTLTAFVDPDISPALLFDPGRLQQVLGNLVNNAIKFTPQGGVSISAWLAARRPGEDLVRLEVKDTGIGMTPEEQARVFEAFAQASAETTQRFGGTGLGLSISRQLTRLMGGTIEMRSRAAVGTEIRITIPMKTAPADALSQRAGPAIPHAALARRAPPGVDAAAREGKLVLVVDDHPINRMVLLKQVNALGYAGEIAESGGEALEKWASGRFALLLLDCNMPEVSGYDVARAVRAREKQEGRRPTAIIACTANALIGEEERCTQSGMNGYLVKPIELAGLAGVLAAWLPGAPLQHALLDEITGGDEQAVHEVLDRFRRCNEEDCARLREALHSGALERVVDACHRIKGSARTIGAADFADACAAIEDAARAGDRNGAAAGLERFERELGRLEAYIDSRSATA